MHKQIIADPRQRYIIMKFIVQLIFSYYRTMLTVERAKAKVTRFIFSKKKLAGLRESHRLLKSME